MQQSAQLQLLIGGRTEVKDRKGGWVKKKKNMGGCRIRRKKDIKVKRAEREKSSCKGKEGKKCEEMEGEEERAYSGPVFQLITTEGPGAAVRHIFFTIFLLQTLINSEPCHLVLHGWALRPLFLRLTCTAGRRTVGCHMG